MARTACGGVMSHGRSDEGSATIWILAIGLALVFGAVAIAMAGAGTLARHKAQAAADLAALAGALRTLEGEQAACQRAAEISARNGAQLVSCHLDGLDVVVVVEVAPALLAGTGVARAAARAGPVESAAHIELTDDHKGQSPQEGEPVGVLGQHRVVHRVRVREDGGHLRGPIRVRQMECPRRGLPAEFP
jgi:secretion/DNA translocation related TadE-like protein